MKYLITVALAAGMLGSVANAAPRGDEFKAWCAANPQECDEAKANYRDKLGKAKAWCQDNPQECSETKQRFRDKAASNGVRTTPMSAIRPSKTSRTSALNASSGVRTIHRNASKRARSGKSASNRLFARA